jgi:type I restriction enzyme S subunit
MSKQENKLVPELRFPEFRKDEEWKIDKVENLILTITPPKKLPSSDYLQSGKFPIIDQSKNFYCGWTNDETSVITTNLPLIIFGDHTCILKLATKPFAQGADGIKIFKPKNKQRISTKFLFQYLKYNEVKLEDYKRHFSILKEKKVLFPIIETGEQQKIASCLSSLDDVIVAHTDKLENLKQYKKGLLQNVFPQEGETVPKLRFKEFENDGEWNKVNLGKYIEIKGRIGYRGYTKEDIVKRGQGAISLSPSNINDNNTLNFEKCTYINWDKYNESPEIILKDGYTVLVKTGSSYGKVALIKNLPEKTTINPQIVVLKPKNICSNFLFYIMSNNDIQIQIKATVVGGAIPTLSQDSVSKFEIKIPIDDKNLKEQKKIASLLSSVDDLIKAETDKIEQLKAHKKGLLQGLFPKIES